MRSRHETGKTETEIEEEFEQKKQDLQANLQDQLSNILGFNEGMEDIKHNFRQLDALPYAKEGTLQEKLDELFG